VGRHVGGELDQVGSASAGADAPGWAGKDAALRKLFVSIVHPGARRVLRVSPKRPGWPIANSLANLIATVTTALRTREQIARLGARATLADRILEWSAVD
jgi:hypothetical protein